MVIAAVAAVIGAGVLVAAGVRIERRPVVGDAMFVTGIGLAWWALVTIATNARRWLDEATAWDWWVVLPAVGLGSLLIAVAFAALVVALDRGER